MQKKINLILLSFLPIIFSFWVAYDHDIAKVPGFLFKMITYSIYMIGIPFILFCVPYVFYFYLVKLMLKLSYKVAGITCGIIIIIVLIIGFNVKSRYKDYEKKYVFTKETTSKLEQIALTSYEKEYGVKGRITKTKIQSHLAKEMNDNGSIQERRFEVLIAQDNFRASNGKVVLEHYYRFVSNHGKWKLNKIF